MVVVDGDQKSNIFFKKMFLGKLKKKFNTYTYTERSQFVVFPLQPTTEYFDDGGQKNISNLLHT